MSTPSRQRAREALLSPSVLRDVVVQAIVGLYHHWFRAALSMLGISWGIVSVVVLLAYGDGFSGALDAGFAGAFSDGVAVTMLGQTSKQAGGERAGKRVRLTIADVEAIGALPLVSDVSPEFMKDFPVIYGNKTVEPHGARRRRELRRDAQRAPAAGWTLPRRRGRPPAPTGGVHRQRGAAQAVRHRCRPSARRSGSAGSCSR